MKLYLSRVASLVVLLSLWIPNYVNAAEVTTGDNSWTVTSGPNSLRLVRSDGALYAAGLSPSDEKPSDKTPLLRLILDGKVVPPSDLPVEAIDTTKGPDSARIVARLKHAKLPLEIEVACIGWSDTGVFWNEITLTNNGAVPIEIDEIASLSLTLPENTADLNWLDGRNPSERQLKVEHTDGRPLGMSNDNFGRSTRNGSSWWSLHIPKHDLSYTSQLAYSGNWSARYVPEGDSISISVAMTFDNNGPLRIAPGKSFPVPPAAVTVSRGDDWDLGANALHRFQRQHIIPRQPTNEPLLVEYNTWYSLSGTVDAEKVKKLIPLAADIGCEAFVIDANWHRCPGDSKEWQENLGDWIVNREKFPEGLAPISKLAHDRGMKFGIWLEPEVASPSSEVFREHPEWFLPLYDKPLLKSKRYHLDFSQPEVRERMMAVVDRLMQECPIEWLKFDYNIDIGNNFDARTRTVEENTRLHDHLEGYFRWLDELARKYPKLIIENCSSGGRRWDLAIAKHTHTSWISDTVNPRFSVQVAHGALIEFVPETCNHWMIGDVGRNRRAAYNATITSTDPGWWDFMFRIAMNGQTGVSSRLDLWSPEALENAKQNIALYKRIRGTIAGADVYHLTEAPAAGEKATGWLALEYAQPNQKSGVLMAYRLPKSKSEKIVKLKGLSPDRTYNVSCDGKVAGHRTGKALRETGLRIGLPEEWRGLAIEVAEAPKGEGSDESTPLMIMGYENAPK